MTQIFSGMIIEREIMGSRGLLRGRGASPLPLQGVLKGPGATWSEKEAEPPLSFLDAGLLDLAIFR